MTFSKLSHVALIALLTIGCNHVKKAGGEASAGGAEQARGGFSGSAFTMHEALEAKPSLRPQAITVATVNGDAADKEDHSVVMAVCDVATLGGTSPTLNVKVQESATSGGTYADVTGAAFTQFTAARSNAVYVGSVSLRQRLQFLRLVATGAGTTPTGNFACNLIFGGAANIPVTLTNAADFNKTN